MSLTASTLDPADAVLDHVIPAGDGWIHEIKQGQTFRIVDLEGNQAADTIFFDAADPADRYSAQDTVRTQNKLYLTTGSPLLSLSGKTLLTITADTCGQHDTFGGACAAESNRVRYALDKSHMHNCRDTFLLKLSEFGLDIGKRELGHNINFFMNVPVTPEGGLTFEDGVSAPGKYVEMVAERDVIALISNCPQLNNPCNAYNPTPIRVLIWNP